MTVTFHVEPWASYYPECVPLWVEHYEEFAPAHEGKMEMGPDVRVYEALDKAGQLQVLVARSAGQMVGYCLVAIRPHIHYSKSLCGFEDSYFVTKSHRKGLVGYKLIKETLRHLEQRGVQRAYFMTKEFLSIAKLLERLGMKKIDTVYAIWLGA
jgi:GNAT superfamily N-acetyltransferase